MPLFTFTRDAESCHELHPENFKSNDPSLSDYGLQVALHFSDKLPWLGKIDQSDTILSEEHIWGEKTTHDTFNTTNLMYVSCLVRSWMTAICLMRNCSQVTLRISKYFKNEHVGLRLVQSDSFPESFKHQVARVLYFLGVVQRYLSSLDVITLELDERDTPLLVRFKKNAHHSWEIDKQDETFVYPREYLVYRKNGIQEFMNEKKDASDFFHVVCHTKQLISFVRKYDVNADLRSRPAEGNYLEDLEKSFLDRKKYWEQLYTLVVEPEQNKLNIWRIQGDLPPKSWKRRELKFNTMCVSDRFPTLPFKTRVLGEPSKEFVLPPSYTRYVPKYIQIGDVLFSGKRPPLTTPVFDPTMNQPIGTEQSIVEKGLTQPSPTRKKWRWPSQVFRDWWNRSIPSEDPDFDTKYEAGKKGQHDYKSRDGSYRNSGGRTLKSVQRPTLPSKTRRKRRAKTYKKRNGSILRHRS